MTAPPPPPPPPPLSALVPRPNDGARRHADDDDDDDDDVVGERGRHVVVVADGGDDMGNDDVREYGGSRPAATSALDERVMDAARPPSTRCGGGAPFSRTPPFAAPPIDPERKKLLAMSLLERASNAGPYELLILSDKSSTWSLMF
jgi:hypothetical protein